MGRFLLFFAVLISFLSFTFISEAEEKHGRLFAGAGLSYVVEDFDDGDLKDFPGNSSIDNSWGINIFAGYWWLKHLAVEGNFNWYDEFDGKAASDIEFDISIWTVMLDLKIISPSLWEDRIFPYARIGGGYMVPEIDADNVDRTDDDFAYNIGLGADVFLTDRLSVGLDGKRVWGTGDASDYNHFVGTVRIGYHF